MDKIMLKAEKAGVATKGALAVAHHFADSQDSYLLVFPDRVDVVRMKKIGAMFGGDAGVESYPVAAISSASIRQSGIWSHLVLTGSNFELEFQTDLVTGPAVRAAVMEAKAS